MGRSLPPEALITSLFATLSRPLLSRFFQSLMKFPAPLLPSHPTKALFPGTGYNRLQWTG